MLKPWKKWTSRRRQQHRKSRNKSHGESETEDPAPRRALPPVPVASSPNANGENEEDQEDQMLADLALRMEEMEPGTAFMPDDEYEEENDDLQHSEEEAFDFSKSIEKVKSVRQSIVIPN